MHCFRIRCRRKEPLDSEQSEPVTGETGTGQTRNLGAERDDKMGSGRQERLELETSWLCLKGTHWYLMKSYVKRT